MSDDLRDAVRVLAAARCAEAKAVGDNSDAFLMLVYALPNGRSGYVDVGFNERSFSISDEDFCKQFGAPMFAAIQQLVNRKA